MISLPLITPPKQSRCSAPSCIACVEGDSEIDFAERIALIRHEYENATRPWFLGFSGGKDSSALLALVYEALRTARGQSVDVQVVYCDTGVDIPTIAHFVHRTLRRIQRQARSDGLPLTVGLAQPRLSERYFVKVIGRGYAPPTNKFRWCTDPLRIDPVKRLLTAKSHLGATVLLGTRSGESDARDRALARHGTGLEHYYRQSGSQRDLIFAPIDDFGVSDVWLAATRFGPSAGLDVERLMRLYRDAGSECPIVRDPRGKPCGVGRFGCWTCTVVRKDKAVSSMVSEGHEDLLPLLQFRNWLAEIRDDRSLRCSRRRNGAPGPGPFTLVARQRILRRLRATQARVPWELITQDEITEIRRLWRADRRSDAYLQLEEA